MAGKVHPKRSKEAQARLEQLQRDQANMKPGDKPRNDGPASPKLPRKPR